jgi:hypothetical protein
MRDVTTSTTDVIDIWPYVAAIPASELNGHATVTGVIEHAYRNGAGTFDHVLVLTKTKNTYLVVVVDLVADRIHGHRILDLKAEYGLT